MDPKKQTLEQQIVQVIDWRARDATSVATSAWDAVTRALPLGLSLIDALKHKFTAQDPDPANKLPALGIRFGWQYAKLTHGELERLVPDRKSRAGIMVVLAAMGLLPDTQFSEEHLRYFQGRPSNLFVDQIKIALAMLSIDAFIALHGSGHLKYEHSVLGPYLSRCSVYTVLDFVTCDVDELQQQLVRRSGKLHSTRYLELLNVLVGTHGLWTSLWLTPDEQKIVQSWNEKLL